MNEILMIVSIVAVVLALAFLVYLIISENKKKTYKTISKSKNKNTNKNEEFGNFKEVDINGVRSSILLGNNLLDTEEDYEEYRKKIMELKLPKGDK